MSRISKTTRSEKSRRPASSRRWPAAPERSAPPTVDGTGSAARFGFNQGGGYYFVEAGVAVDLSGNVYVADTGNDAIRVVSPAGVVTTIAGLAGQPGFVDGAGSAARFDHPTAVALVETTGELYVVDRNNRAIRKITPDGVVSTVAGSPERYGIVLGGAPSFSDPRVITISGTSLIVGDAYSVLRLTCAQ